MPAGACTAPGASGRSHRNLNPGIDVAATLWHAGGRRCVDSDMQLRRRATDPPQRQPGGDPARRRLTDRERAVALLVADGLPDRLIARRLGIMPRTVAGYIQRIRIRLRLDDRQAVVDWVAARRGPDGMLRRAEGS